MFVCRCRFSLVSVNVQRPNRKLYYEFTNKDDGFNLRLTKRLSLLKAVNSVPFESKQLTDIDFVTTKQPLSVEAFTALTSKANHAVNVIIGGYIGNN